MERWLGKNDGLELFFIKNLENVQGDERDVIFIGTVYGPEAIGGPVMQRFPGINGVAGKRRLNVLFSRAKQQIVTFSSMTAADIRADEHANPGRYMLKCWLEYAATGVLHVGETTGREPDSDFEVFVIDQLRSMGCSPMPQVGVAGFFIDIGVRHPDWPHGYIMGVECDGATYHSSRSARDRDRLREEVLRGLGWNLHRIWSTDWFNDPNKEARRLRDAIETRLNELKQQERQGCEAEVSTGEIVPEDSTGTSEADLFGEGLSEPVHAPPSAGGQTNLVEEDISRSYLEVGDKAYVRYLDGASSDLTVTLSDTRNDPLHGIVHVDEPLGRALIGAEEGDEIEVLVGNFVRKAFIEQVIKSEKTRHLDDDGNLQRRRTRSSATVSGYDRNEPFSENSESPAKNSEERSLGENLNPDRFYEPEYRRVLQAIATQLIDRHGPVTFRHLSEIIARKHGFLRTGSQIKRQVWAAIGKTRRSSKAPNKETIFWPLGMEPAEHMSFRGLGANGEDRTWREVPYPEMLGLAVDIVTCSRTEDPAAEMASRIGLSRLKQATREELEILLLAARKHISESE